MKIVGTDTLEVERALVAVELVCPECGGRLRPWGRLGGGWFVGRAVTSGVDRVVLGVLAAR